MLRRSRLIAGAVGLTGALSLLPWWWPPADGETDKLPVAGLPPTPPAAPAAAPVEPVGAKARPAASPAASPPNGHHAGRPIGAALLSATAPPELLVGETGELVIRLGADHAVAEVHFTVSFDGNVLQVRTAAEGDWAAGSGGARFAADIADAEDRVHVRSAVAGRRSAAAGASVALVQFQAVAPGSTSIVISDLVARDPAGQPLPCLLLSSNLQVTAASLPPARPRLAPARSVVADPAPAAEPFDSEG